MKIGLLTFHYAHNYGAVLQAYALKTFLSNNGHEVVFINYRNKKIASVYNKKLPCKYSFLDFIHIRKIPKMIRENLDTIYSRSDWYKQWTAFESFISRYLINEVELHDISQLSNLYDVIIAGSDQIWNSDLTGGLDPIYFLDFDTNAKKIFYGASNGSSIIPPQHKEYYKKVLTNAFKVSTRESSLANNIINSLDINAIGVVDPTILLQRSDYKRLISNTECSESYIFTYFITEDPVLMDVSEFLSRVLKIEVIELHFYKRRDLKKHNQFADMGPEEFLWYIKHARLVLTNSFHGTVFSLLFHKNFYSVYKTDARKDELLKATGCMRRHITKISDIDLNDYIDYSQVDSMLDALRTPSKMFLYQSLET